LASNREPVVFVPRPPSPASGLLLEYYVNGGTRARCYRWLRSELCERLETVRIRLVPPLPRVPGRVVEDPVRDDGCGRKVARKEHEKELGRKFPETAGIAVDMGSGCRWAVLR
jgi:hypothetical protein